MKRLAFAFVLALAHQAQAGDRAATTASAGLKLYTGTTAGSFVDSYQLLLKVALHSVKGAFYYGIDARAGFASAYAYVNDVEYDATKIDMSLAPTAGVRIFRSSPVAFFLQTSLLGGFGAIASSAPPAGTSSTAVAFEYGYVAGFGLTFGTSRPFVLEANYVSAQTRYGGRNVQTGGLELTLGLRFQ